MICLGMVEEINVSHSHMLVHLASISLDDAGVNSPSISLKDAGVGSGSISLEDAGVGSGNISLDDAATAVVLRISHHQGLL
ncbi:hypothetical protein PanWU01x14_141990 [Parasponia andersonii]|uniref:Uncharacterized protein n=1 Tax=Parasponia andersonii TaxID=3476 RepID=A0A2P5CLS3_PARAD|nr:hypothetical protein PanWU01x14_141990 [Parasponia andersonii]